MIIEEKEIVIENNDNINNNLNNNKVGNIINNNYNNIANSNYTLKKNNNRNNLNQKMETLFSQAINTNINPFNMNINPFINLFHANKNNNNKE